ncbi:MAG TPA: maleylpyruvate isomerase N-terminal domain-containing protein [Candidatus Ruania gallistercoris]|uniref:Maleylpyruvate isomerase N-terminal domain-containing protein n=1 Tax=Candidatus Ruania gallistercoris TaxID=2838746 RepID=A0A9D2EEK1_9MICO|nr:maleylpyruvate isomerase N-terminal domain-containing protein [Candidatus Ruania gallistercoris]
MATPAQIVGELRDQWELLHTRLEDTADAVLAEQSSLPGWTVREVVAHLGVALDPINRCEPCEPGGAEPVLSVGEYLAHYAARAEAIAAKTQALAAEAEDVLTAVEPIADRALQHAEVLVANNAHTLVHTRYGAISVGDFLLTRLVELVVHGYDLAPALGDPVPVDSGARHLVAEALLQIVTERTGYRLLMADEEAWILVATGRISWDEAVRREAVRPEYPSDGLPDLAPHLPLL